MVKRWRPITILIVTCALAVSLENEFFLFLLGFEVMAVIASFVQAKKLAKQVKMRVRIPNRVAFRGETFQVRLELTNLGKLPIPQLMARASIRVFPEKEQLLMRGKLMLGSEEKGELCFKMDVQHCACLEICPNQLVITDYLGIVQRRCRVDETEKHLLFVLPENIKNGDLLPEGQGTLLADDGDDARKGHTAIDVAEIRLYQLGDPIKLVHWKLSARLDELLVREMSDPAENMLRVYLNLQEADEHADTRMNKDAWDQFMQTVAGVSAALLEKDKKHVVFWADAENNRMVSQTVTDEESQQMMLCELLRARTFHAGNYASLFKEVSAGESQETCIEIDLQGRIDRSAA